MPKCALSPIIFLKNSCRKICTIQQKAVPLHRKRKNDDSLAQQVEHNTFNVGVLGSSPRRITKREFRQRPVELLLFLHGENNARTGPKTIVDGNKRRLFAIRAPGGSPDESFAKRRWNSCCFYRVTGFQTSRPSVFRLSTTPSGARSDRHATVESTLFRARCAAFAADGGSYDLVLYGIFGIFVECRIDLCLLIHLVESDFRQRIENLFVFCHIISKNCCTFAGEFTPKPCYAAEGVDSLHIDGVY